jgi:hypothetical protein
LINLNLERENRIIVTIISIAQREGNTIRVSYVGAVDCKNPMLGGRSSLCRELNELFDLI